MAESTKDKISLKGYTFQRGGGVSKRLNKSSPVYNGYDGRVSRRRQRRLYDA